MNKTFDDTYGRHALVLREGEDGPAFGRVDVIQLAIVSDATRTKHSYVPRHAR